MVTWHALKDWTENEFVDEDDFNEQLRDNIEFLLSRPFNSTSLSTVNTTSTSFTELTGSSTAVTSFGGNMLIVGTGRVGSNTAGVNVTLDLAVDGTRQGDVTLGLTLITTPANNYVDAATVAMFTSTPPSAGTHNYSIYWKVSGGTGAALMRIYTMEFR